MEVIDVSIPEKWLDTGSNHVYFRSYLARKGWSSPFWV